jgi:YidC/Oxa1 family membrane protein insertase
MDNQRSFLRLVFIYAILFVTWFLILPRFFPQLLPQKPPAPAKIDAQLKGELDKAAKAEMEARTGGARLSLSDRAHKWDEALRAYGQIQRLAGSSATSVWAQFQQARIHEERAASDARNLGDYDLAIRIYKDLERHHPRARVTLEINGRPTPVTAGDYARSKLETALLARDRGHQHDLLYQVMDFFVRLTGRIPGFSYWFALVLITVLVKAILFPFTKRQFKSMADMQRIAPKMKEVQEKLKGRPADEINRKMMAMYKEEGVNPAAGCVPMIAQIAALIPLYNMIRLYEYQFRKGYFLWIGSELSRQHPQYIATSLAVPDVPLLLLYLVSMFLTTKLQPPAADPQQAQQQKMMAYMMPIFFGWITWNYAWPSAFTFYWLVLNLISTYQQWHILKVVGAHSAAGSSGTGPGASSRGGPAGRGGTDGSNGRNGGRPVRPSGGRSGSAKRSARR